MKAKVTRNNFQGQISELVSGPDPPKATGTKLLEVGLGLLRCPLHPPKEKPRDVQVNVAPRSLGRRMVSAFPRNCLILFSQISPFCQRMEVALRQQTRTFPIGRARARDLARCGGETVLALAELNESEDSEAEQSKRYGGRFRDDTGRHVIEAEEVVVVALTELESGRGASGVEVGDGDQRVRRERRVSKGEDNGAIPENVELVEGNRGVIRERESEVISGASGGIEGLAQGSDSLE